MIRAYIDERCILKCPIAYSENDAAHIFAGQNHAPIKCATNSAIVLYKIDRYNTNLEK